MRTSKIGQRPGSLWFAFLIEVMRANLISKHLFILGETTLGLWRHLLINSFVLFCGVNESLPGVEYVGVGGATWRKVFEGLPREACEHQQISYLGSCFFFQLPNASPALFP